MIHPFRSRAPLIVLTLAAAACLAFPASLFAQRSEPIDSIVVRQSRHARPVDIHHVDLGVAVTGGSEREHLTIG